MSKPNETRAMVLPLSLKRDETGVPRRIVDAEGKNILILDPEAEPVNNEYAPMVIRQLNNDFRVKELIYLMAKRHAKHLKSAYISMEKLESLFREKKNRWWL